MPRRTSGPGDPTKLLGLLWSPSLAVGRSGATLAAITRTAITVADEEGLDALTMRRVATEVGVGAMTLYSYVPGRAELVELMLDTVAAEVYAAHPVPSERPGWRAGLEHVAVRNWEHHLAHRWTVDVAPARPVLGPGVSVKYELELAPLDGIGLDDLEMDHVLTTVLGMTTAAARWQVGLERVRGQSALSDEQWWHQAAPVYARAASRLDLTVAARVGQSVGSAGEPHAALVYGLDRLLDGVQSRVDEAG